MTRFHDQMKEAREADDGRIIRDNPSWTLDDYRDFMFCVEKGYLVQKESTTLFMINLEWELVGLVNPYAEEFVDMKCEDCGDEGSVSGSPDSKLCPDCYDKKEEEEETGFGTAYHDGSGFDDCDPEGKGNRLCSEYPKDKWCSECVHLHDAKSNCIGEECDGTCNADWI